MRLLGWVLTSRSGVLQEEERTGTRKMPGRFQKDPVLLTFVLDSGLWDCEKMRSSLFVGVAMGMLARGHSVGLGAADSKSPPAMGENGPACEAGHGAARKAPENGCFSKPRPDDDWGPAEGCTVRPAPAVLSL